jgi:fatty-acyl-CoA synthase
METLGSFLDDLVVRHARREAVAYAPREVVTARMGWEELRAGSRVAAKKLLAAGAGKGTRIAFLCSNRPEWLPIAFGAARLGAILVPLSTLWKRDELAYALTHADVELVVTLPTFLRHDYLAALREIVPELGVAPAGGLRSAHAPALRRVVALEGDAPGIERWGDLAADADDTFLDALERAVSPVDPAVVFFTSGTTAQAKAVVQSHASLTTSARRIAECLGIGPDDVWWGHMPLFWSGGFVMGALATLAGGGRLVLQETVEPGAALALLEQERCTIMLGWHQAAPLLEHPDFPRRRLALKKGSGGTHPLAVKLLGADHASVGMYGMTETATCITCGRWDDPASLRTGTFGRPLAGMEVRIVDPDTGRVAATGAPGEILVRGPTLMEGYYRVPRASAFDADGFFRTGDLGYFDPDGCLHFTGRLKDVIKTAGVNVAASEVEEALARHPAVKAAYVVGVTDPARGENVAAFVVGHPDAATDPTELQTFCRSTLASYKVPRHLFVIDDADVPRTGSGKIDKGALRRAAEARRASSS